MDEQTFYIRWKRHRIVFLLTLILEMKSAFNTVSILPSVDLKLECFVANKDRITVIVSCIRTSSPCPICHQPSARVHSRYTRTLADLPWCGVPVQVILQTRKFYCQTTTCRRAIFTANLSFNSHMRHFSFRVNFKCPNSALPGDEPEKMYG